jgi:type VI secretion system secreted protein VgrG
MANLSISFPGAPGLDLSVRYFDITEGLGRPFEVMIVAASRDPDLDFEALIGEPVRCRIDGGARGARAWAGVCAFIDQTETEADGRSLYVFRVVPSLWLLGQRRNHRAFLNLSAPGVARALLRAWKIEASLHLDERRFPVREYRVQYGESDLAFLARTLEDAGISYFFEGGEGSPLVLTDAPERGELRPVPIPLSADAIHGSAGPHVAHARRGSEVRPGAVEISDFDFLKPRYRASFQASSGSPVGARLEQHIYAPGAAAEGDPRADRTLLALGEGRRTAGFTTNLVDLAPGVVFSTTAEPERRLCVISTSLAGNAQGRWKIAAVAAPCDAPIRPAQKTPRPRMEGVESAVVVGPPDEEIHVDEHGRVRLRFPWDREGGPNDDRTPWVRVAEGWAGAGWGMITMPRVGQEVLVAYFDGDPDQPVVVGRAHGASSPPPEVLPAARTRSVWRSRSTPGAAGYHEIAFDDRRGNELVQVRSERDLEKVALHDEIENAGLDRTATVGRHLSATIGGDDAHAAGEMHAVSISGSTTRREIAAKRIALTTGDATILLDGPDILITGRSGVAIKAGGTVSIQGEPYVHINPPHASGSGAAASSPAPDHVVHYKLVSEGHPLAGARTYVQHEDGSASGPQVTDANGLVRLPVDKAGTYQVKLGTPPVATEAKEAKEAKTATAKAPAIDPVTGGVAAPTTTPSPAPTTIGVGQTPAQPRTKSTPTEHDVPVSLEIVEPKPGTTFDILTTPAMPEIPLHAKVMVQGAPVAIGSVRWELHASGNYRVRDASGASYVLQSYVLPVGDTRTTPGEAKRYLLAPPELVGGELEIKAIFDGGAALGGITASKSVKGCQVLGKDPEASVIEASIVALTGPLAWLYLRLFAWESTLTQFARQSGNGNTPGWPLYGAPSGTGIVQRDPVATEWVWGKSRVTQANNFFPRIFWNWKKNLAEGVSSFTSTYIERGRGDLDALRSEFPHLPPYPEGVLLRASIRRYNGGTEYVASADGRHYLVSPDSTNPGYVDDVFSVPQISAQKYPIPADALATEWP